MKPSSKYSFLIICLYCIITAAQCKKDKLALPPETQEGKNTFGCLVNGQVLTPKGGGIAPNYDCYYQYLNTSTSKRYFFQVKGVRNGSNCELTSIRISTDSLKIEQGKKYPLKKIAKGNAIGSFH